MSLSDIIGSLGLEAAPKIALVFFLIAFALILIGALARSRKQEFDEASRLPLADDDPPHDGSKGRPTTRSDSTDDELDRDFGDDGIRHDHHTTREVPPR